MDRHLCAACGITVLVLSGCAAPTLDAQWVDPRAPAAALRGQRVLVACEAYDTVIRKICQDHMAAELTARGATPVLAPDSTAAAGGRPVPDEQYLPAARAAGARAVFAATVSQGDAYLGGGSGASIGLGGFGFGGGRRSGGGVGVGVSVPIGGGGGYASSRYAATGRLTDTASGRLLWTAKATASSSGDVGAQMGELARTVLGAADKAGMF